MKKPPSRRSKPNGVQVHEREGKKQQMKRPSSRTSKLKPWLLFPASAALALITAGAYVAFRLYAMAVSLQQGLVNARVAWFFFVLEVIMLGQLVVPLLQPPSVR